MSGTAIAVADDDRGIDGRVNVRIGRKNQHGPVLLASGQAGAGAPVADVKNKRYRLADLTLAEYQMLRNAVGHYRVSRENRIFRSLSNKIDTAGQVWKLKEREEK